ncbi:GDP-mannose 4,6-dehydratase [Candidatus Uabimicrobium sp. HlEnr_7]|uniref:GDP-mannose 4,6-dehydratase n=1 Tax=Candidatus Uabimicrobium helgolandensis TaxID=3095367 RepID=UPI0035582968
MKYQKILITGGAGFIGSHLAEFFLKKKCQVTIVDNLSTGQWANIQHLENNESFSAVISCVTDEKLMDDLVREHDIVYHLASAVGVKLIMEKPIDTINTIFQTTDTMIKKCSRYRKPFIFTSTSEVYGKLDKEMFSEDSDVLLGCAEKHRWAYAATKAVDEFLILGYHSQTNLPVYITRLFNTVGPRQTGQYGMVLPNFVERALRNETIQVFGNGEQTRCFCSVYDVVRALAQFPLSPEAIGKVVNIGSQQEISIKNLALKVIEKTGSSSQIELVPYSKVYGAGFDDILKRVPDLTRAQNLLQWSPEYSLDAIIEQVIEDKKIAKTP